MFIYGLMKFVESASHRYDHFMDLMTFGHYSKAKNAALENIGNNQLILDVGCGTGNYTIECAKRGSKVVALDASIQMLSILKNKMKAQKLEDQIEIHECGVSSLERIANGRKFDKIIFSMMLGELPNDVRFHVLKAASTLLAPQGEILIIDELWPTHPLANLFYTIAFYAFYIPNFLFTRTVIRPVKNLDQDLTLCSLKTSNKRSYFGGIISILRVQCL